MIGILYFSSTGNSLYAAKQVQAKLGGELRYIPKLSGTEQYERIIIVSPIYSFGLPKHVFELLPTLPKDTPIDFLLTYGGMVGGADRFTYTHCRSLGLSVRSVHTLKMAENFTLTFTSPKFYVDATLKAVPRHLAPILESLRKEETVIPKEKRTKEEAYRKNMASWHTLANDFSVSEDCVRCGVCITVCPVQNISLENGKITFADRCVACIGCYHRCPKKAIVYQGRNKKDRYFHPEIDPNDIGRDF